MEYPSVLPLPLYASNMKSMNFCCRVICKCPQIANSRVTLPVKHHAKKKRWAIPWNDRNSFFKLLPLFCNSFPQCSPIHTIFLSLHHLFLSLYFSTLTFVHKWSISTPYLQSQWTSNAHKQQRFTSKSPFHYWQVQSIPFNPMNLFPLLCCLHMNLLNILSNLLSTPSGIEKSDRK